MEEKTFTEAKEQAVEIYGKIIPRLVEIQKMMKEYGIDDGGAVSSFEICSDGYVRAKVKGLMFYVLKIGDGDFRLSCEYTEDFPESVGEKSA